MATPRLFAGFLIVLVLASCNNNTGDKDAMTVVERPGEPEIYELGDNDKRMNAAIDSAVQTIHLFKAALLSKADSLEAFSLKVKYSMPDGYDEHIWVSDIRLEDSVFTGYIGNTPNVITEVKLGDFVRIRPERISDWMYLASNKLRGGFTIRAIRDKLSPQERTAFDGENGFIIE
jgi:uncharacterized protein YegJ (DUF2314 family)